VKMAMKHEFEEFKARENPTTEDYRELVSFTSRILRQIKKERGLRSKLSEENKKLTDRLGSLYIKEKSIMTRRIID